METATAPKKVFREIDFELTQEEIVKKATHVGEVSQKIQLEEANLKALVKERKGVIAALEKDVNETLSVILARREVRNVEVEVRKNYEGNAVEYVHEGRVVDSRPMEADDRQMELVKGGLDDGSGPDDEEFDDEGGPDDDGGEALPLAAQAEALTPPEG